MTHGNEHQAWFSGTVACYFTAEVLEGDSGCVSAEGKVACQLRVFHMKTQVV